MTRRFTVLFRAAGRELPALQLNIDTLYGECSVLRYAAASYHSAPHFTFYRWDSQTGGDVKNIYRWSKSGLASQLSKTPNNCPHSLEMSYANQPFVSPYSDLTSRFQTPDLLASPAWNSRRQTLLNPDGSGLLFLVGTIPDNTSPTPFMQDHNGRPLWLLDYTAVPTSTVIRQVRWTPENVNNHRHHVSEAVLQMPIFFMQKNCVLGLSLNDAMNGRCQTLRDARMPSSVQGENNDAYSHRSRWPLAPHLCVESPLTILVTFQWPGYNEFKRQV